jgi:4-amino-4-deoxy-L-arabinose transferase-like glycosyltransferase
MGLNRISQDERFIIFLIVGIGLIPRLYLFHLHQVIDYDGVYYAMLGKNLFSGLGYTEPEGIYQWYYPPFYPVNIGLLWSIFGNLEFASKSVSLIYGIFCIPLTYLIARKLYGTKEAVLGGILVAMHPNLIRFSSTDTAESLFVCLLLAAILIALNSVGSDNLLKFGLLGLLLGLMFLTKPAGVQYFVFFIAVFIVSGLMKKKDIIRIIKQIGIIVLIFSLFAAPYLIFLKNHFGYWTLSELATRNLVRSQLMFQSDNHQKVYQMTDDGKEMKYFTSQDYSGVHISLLELFKNNPSVFFKRYFDNLAHEFILIFDKIKKFAVPVVILIFLNFLQRHLGRNRLENELILFAAVIPLFTQPMISSASIRWMLPFVPILLIWTAGGIVSLQEWLQSKLKRSILVGKYTIITVSLVWLLLVMIPFIRGAESYAGKYPHEHKAMGLILRDSNVSADTVIMAVTPHVAFYAGTRLKIMPWGAYPEIISYARYHNVDFIVIDEDFIPRRPQMMFLLDDREAPPELQLAYSLENENRKKIMVYRLKSKN